MTNRMSSFMSSLGSSFSMAVVLALSACNGDKDAGETDEPAADGETLLFLDGNNYDYTATLELSSLDVQAGADCTVDWSGFTTDYRGRPVDPLEVSRVTLAAIRLDHDTLITRINDNSLTQGDIGDYREAYPSGVTSMQLSEMSIIGADFIVAEDFVEDDRSWLLTLWKDNDRGVSEILTSLFVVPLDTSTNTVISVTNTSATLTFDADLTTSAAIVTVADADAYALNWTGVNTDVHGATFDALKADTLRIAHLPVETVAEAEALFLQLDIAATETYYLTVFGVESVPDLSAAREISDATPFPGFTSDGIWLLSFECTDLSCFSPAPLLLAVVEVQ